MKKNSIKYFLEWKKIHISVNIVLINSSFPIWTIKKNVSSIDKKKYILKYIIHNTQSDTQTKFKSTQHQNVQYAMRILRLRSTNNIDSKRNKITVYGTFFPLINFYQMRRHRPTVFDRRRVWKRERNTKHLYIFI